MTILNKTIQCVSILLLMISATACTHKTTTTDPAPEKENVSLATVIAKETPSKRRQTPAQSVISQITWELSNKQKVAASSDAIQWDVTFGSEGTVAAKLPGTTQSWYNIALLKIKDNGWIIEGFIDFPVPKETKIPDKKGLALPLNKFNTMNMSLSSRHVYAFANDTKVIAISKSPQKSFIRPNGYYLVSSQKPDAYIKSDAHQSSLYYFDSDHLVWIGGNISQAEIITLANSLASVTSTSFPYVRE